MAKSTQKYTPRPGTKREIIVGMLEKGEPVEKIHKALDRYAKKQGREPYTRQQVVAGIRAAKRRM